VALHVDVVQNEWLAGYQERVAKLRMQEGGIKVECDDDKWVEVVLRPTAGLDPVDGPEEFFHGLHGVLAGDYLCATTPHHEKDCPFHRDARLPLVQQPVERVERRRATASAR
jgi:hypothetical protein